MDWVCSGQWLQQNRVKNISYCNGKDGWETNFSEKPACFCEHTHMNVFKNPILLSSASPNVGIVTKQCTKQHMYKQKPPPLQAISKFKGLGGDQPQTA